MITQDGTKYVSKFDRPWLEHAQAGRLAGAVVEYVRSRDWVSFPELRGALEPYFSVRGDSRLDIADNVTLWAGLSAEFADTIADLERAHRLFFHPASLMVYLVDGGVLNLPVAKRLPKGGYKSLHWLPVVLRTVPPMERKRGTRR